MIAHNDPSHVRDRVLRLFEQHHIPANILVSLPSLEGIKRAVAMQMGVALLPRRCAESEIARGELVALAMPEIRLRRQVRLVFRKGGERSHAAAAFLSTVEEEEVQPRSHEEIHEMNRGSRCFVTLVASLMFMVMTETAGRVRRPARRWRAPGRSCRAACG